MNKQTKTDIYYFDSKGKLFSTENEQHRKNVFQVYNLKTAGEPKMFAGNREKRAPDSKHLIQG